MLAHTNTIRAVHLCLCASVCVEIGRKCWYMAGNNALQMLFEHACIHMYSDFVYTQKKINKRVQCRITRAFWMNKHVCIRACVKCILVAWTPQEKIQTVQHIKKSEILWNSLNGRESKLTNEDQTFCNEEQRAQAASQRRNTSEKRPELMLVLFHVRSKAAQEIFPYCSSNSEVWTIRTRWW